MPVEDTKEKARWLMGHMVRPLVTVDWWDKTLSLIDSMSRDTPCYTLEFDKSGKVADVILELCG